MLSNQVKLVFRRLKRSPYYTLVNMSGLTVSLTAVLFITIYVKDEVSFDRFHAKAGKIYRVVQEHNRLGPHSRIPSDFVEIFEPDIPEIESYTRLSNLYNPVLVGTKDKQLNMTGVFMTDPGFFDFFSFRLIHGSANDAFAESGHAVITESASRLLFGDEHPVGKTIEIEKGEQYIISAVAADAPKNSTIQFKVLLYRKGYFKNRFEETRGVSTAITYVSIHAGSDLTGVEEKINQARAKPIYSRLTKNSQFVLLPLTDQRLHSPYETDTFDMNDIGYVRLFSGIGFVVLLLAMINYVNLVTSQSIRKMKEVGLRKVIGAGRRQLIYYQLLESIVLTTLSFLLAFAIVERLMPFFNEVMDKAVRVQYFSLEFFIYGVLFSLLLGAISGFYPAFYITRVKPLALINRQVESVGRGRHFKKGLVLFQFVATAMLMSVLVIMRGQMQFLKEKELGFETDFVISAPLDRDSTHLFTKLKTTFLAIPGVKSTSLTGFRLGVQTMTSLRSGPNESGKGGESIGSNVVFADEDLIKTIGMQWYWQSPMFESSTFKENKVLVNYTLAKEQGWLENPEGRKIFGWNDQAGKQVVGIVKDFHSQSLKEVVEPLAILPLTEWGTRQILIKLEGQVGLEAIEPLAQAYQSLFDRPFAFEFLDDQIARFYKKERGQFRLFQVFSALALFISMLGLVALTTHTVQQRRKEISIRKVLGASIGRLMLLLNKEYVILVLVAFLIASPVAYYVMQMWLNDFSYRISLDPTLFIITFTLFLATCWVVTFGQSLNVSRENPADVLRNE